MLLNKCLIAGEAVGVAKLIAWSEGPRSPMMTVSGIAAEGLPVDAFTRRIAAESVSPQLIAVLGRYTELRFAVVPVISFI